MTTPMFCYQCEQTGKGPGCIGVGVCGKDSAVSALQDLLIYQLQGLGFYGHEILSRGGRLPAGTDAFVIDALFSTLTNVDFDAARFIPVLNESQRIKAELRGLAGSVTAPAAARYDLPRPSAAIYVASKQIDIRPAAETAPDIQSLKDTLLYGIKGMAAYARHALVLGHTDQAVNDWLYKGLAATLDETLDAAGLLSLLLEFGQVNLQCMALLDKANTGAYGNPEPTYVSITRKAGPFIVVSGHDLLDLAQLLEQTAGKGINIYTHGEMLPAHAYPQLKRYPHLAGNFGGAWQNQQREFDQIPGCVLMTTNCIQEPKPSYRDRIFTTGVVGFPGVPHIDEVDGVKDFSPVIEKALELGGWTENDPERKILVGFGHEAVLSNAGKIIDAVKAGQIKHFFLVGGCDGAKPGRNYYSEFVEKTPKDSVVLTLACGKYRFNKKQLGTVAGLPRLLDIGQCNDAYSAIQIAVALAGAFNCGVNDLPLTLVLSWYEQKAVCILLTLLSLGIKNIYLGPTLPAFLSPNVVNLLVQQYDLHPVTTVAADMAAMLN